MDDKKYILCDADKAVSKATITQGSLLINFDNSRIRKSVHFKGLLTDLQVPRTFKSESRESYDEEIHAKLQYDLQAAKVREIINITQNPNTTF